MRIDAHDGQADVQHAVEGGRGGSGKTTFQFVAAGFEARESLRSCRLWHGRLLKEGK
jgi:hypothetical protein